MLIINPSNVKPPFWAINPGIVSYNASRMGIPMPVGLWAMWEGGGDKAVNLIYSQHSGILTNNPTWFGQGILLDGTNFSHLDCGKMPIPSKLSIFYKGYTQVPGPNTTDPRICSRHYTSGEYGFTYIIYPDNKFSFFRSTTGSDWAGVSSTGTVVSNERHTGAVTYGDGYATFYKNGTQIGQSAFSGDIYEPNYNFLIGADGYTISAPPVMNWHGLIEILVFFSDILTPNQVATLSADPYGLVQQPKRIWAVVAAAGGLSRSRDIAGNLPAMSGALTRKHYAKRPIQGAI